MARLHAMQRRVDSSATFQQSDVHELNQLLSEAGLLFRLPNSCQRSRRVRPTGNDLYRLLDMTLAEDTIR